MAQPGRSEFSSLVAQLKEYQRLAGHPGETTWIDRYSRPERGYDAVFHLGCNLLRTPHLASDSVAVFQALELDVAAVAGPAFCCGIVQHRAGDAAGAARLTGSTIARFESYGAPRVVSWCPTCILHFQRVSDRHPCSVPVVSYHQYLAEQIERLHFTRPVPSRVALHIHTGTDQADADAAAVLQLLKRVPGLEVAGTICSTDLEYQCQPALIARMGRERFRSIRDSLVAEATALGADTLVTPYHSCQRHWCDVEMEGLRITNYVSLLAEAIGRPHFDYFQAFTRLGDPDRIAALARSRWELQGLDEDEGKRLAERYFVRKSVEK